MIRLSSRTEERLNALFGPDDREEAATLLVEQCGSNVPLKRHQNEHGLERLRFAALKLSDGDLDKLGEAIGLAKVDWRDLLVAAGFASSGWEHKKWWPKRTEQSAADESE